MAVHNRKLSRLFTQRPHSCEELEARRLAVGCDVTQDGACDFADLKVLIDQGFQAGGSSLQFDWYWFNDRDREFNFPPQYIPEWDANGDGIYSYSDVDDWWASAGLTRGDYDADGNLDEDDFLLLWDSSPDMRDLFSYKRLLDYANNHPEDEFAMNIANDYQDYMSHQYHEFILTGFFGLVHGTDTKSQLDRSGTPTIELRGDNQDPLLSVFSLRDGDVNNDARFNSSDLVKVAQEGLADDLDTGELVRIFQLGTYER